MGITTQLMSLLEALLTILPEDSVPASLDVLSTSLSTISPSGDSVATVLLLFPPGDRGRYVLCALAALATRCDAVMPWRRGGGPC